MIETSTVLIFTPVLIAVSVAVTVLFVKKNQLGQESDHGQVEHHPAQHSVLDSMQEMVIALDYRGEILDCNQSFVESAKLEKSMLVGKNYRDIFKIFVVDEHNHLLAEKDLLLTQSYTLFYQNTNDDGGTKRLKLTFKNRPEEAEPVLIEVSISSYQHLPVENGQKNEGAIVLMKDVTMDVSKERLKLDFVSIAAHELRTPLTSIRGYLDAVKTEAWEVLSPEQRQFVERADISTIKLINLMENLLSVTKIERGTYEISLRDIDWLTLMNERIAEFQPRVADRDLELIWNPPDKLPPVKADLLRIAEVVNNLLSNAINYTQSGVITVLVEHDPDKQMVVTHITDTGPGISEKVLFQIFDKFFRVSGILEQGSKGTGLGLYISKKIVELHHGRIWVESKEGKGSTFSFSLPTVKKTQEQTQIQL